MGLNETEPKLIRSADWMQVAPQWVDSLHYGADPAMESTPQKPQGFFLFSGMTFALRSKQIYLVSSSSRRAICCAAASWPTYGYPTVLLPL